MKGGGELHSSENGEWLERDVSEQDCPITNTKERDSFGTASSVSSCLRTSARFLSHPVVIFSAFAPCASSLFLYS